MTAAGPLRAALPLSRGRRDARRRGAALPLVLMFAALLSALAASALRSGLSGARAAAAYLDEIRADELGRGAGDALAFRLATADGKDRRGGRFTLRLPDATVTVDYLSESARVDANLAPVELVAALLVAAGADPAEAEAAAARIAAFRAAAARAAPPAAPRKLPGTAVALVPVAAGNTTAAPPLAIRDVAEVGRAWGLGDDLARRVAPELSVSNGTPVVDPTLADRVVLAALLGADERVDDYLERRKQGFVDRDAALDLLPVPSRSLVGFAGSRAVRGIASVALGNRFGRRYEMVLAPPPPTGQVSVATLGPAVPPVVVSWRRLP